MTASDGAAFPNKPVFRILLKGINLRQFLIPPQSSGYDVYKSTTSLRQIVTLTLPTWKKYNKTKIILHFFSISKHKNIVGTQKNSYCDKWKLGTFSIDFFI